MGEKFRKIFIATLTSMCRSKNNISSRMPTMTYHLNHDRPHERVIRSKSETNQIFLPSRDSSCVKVARSPSHVVLSSRQLMNNQKMGRQCRSVTEETLLTNPSACGSMVMAGSPVMAGSHSGSSDCSQRSPRAMAGSHSGSIVSQANSNVVMTGPRAGSTVITANITVTAMPASSNRERIKWRETEDPGSGRRFDNGHHHVYSDPEYQACRQPLLNVGHNHMASGIPRGQLRRSCSCRLGQPQQQQHLEVSLGEMMGHAKHELPPQHRVAMGLRSPARRSRSSCSLKTTARSKQRLEREKAGQRLVGLTETQCLEREHYHGLNDASCASQVPAARRSGPTRRHGVIYLALSSHLVDTIQREEEEEDESDEKASQENELLDPSGAMEDIGEDTIRLNLSFDSHLASDLGPRLARPPISLN